MQILKGVRAFNVPTCLDTFERLIFIISATKLISQTGLRSELRFSNEKKKYRVSRVKSF